MELDLQALPTIVLHNPANVQRADHMHALLKGLNMRYALYPALNGEGYIVSAAKSLMAMFERELLREPFQPFILLEDDVMICPWIEPTIDLEGRERLVLEVPADADVVYLGLSTCGADPERETHQVGISWEETPVPGIVRLQNMLSQHAVAICSRRWLIMLMRTLSVAASRNLNWDLPVARVMDRYRVYACEQPIFYQDARVGGQQDPTLVTLKDVKRLQGTDYVASAATTLVQFEPPVALREYDVWSDAKK